MVTTAFKCSKCGNETFKIEQELGNKELTLICSAPCANREALGKEKKRSKNVKA